MIVHNVVLQCLECTICGDCVELLRKEYRDQEALNMRREAVAERHKPCEEFADDPARAKAERAYRDGMVREFREDAEKKRRCRPRQNAYA